MFVNVLHNLFVIIFLKNLDNFVFMLCKRKILINFDNSHLHSREEKNKKTGFLENIIT